MEILATKANKKEHSDSYKVDLSYNTSTYH